MLGTHTLLSLSCSVLSKGAIPAGEGLWGTESGAKCCSCDCVYVQNPGGFLLHAWEGKEIGGKSGRFGKEVRGPDYPNILIMSQQTILGLYLPRLCLLQTECLH